MISKAIYTVGRFQPPTLGHAVLIKTLVQIASRDNSQVFVFVSKIQDKNTNPLNSSTKINFLYKLFPTGVTFIDTSKTGVPSGGPIAAFEYLNGKGFQDITLVSGSDREDTFGPKSRMWNYLKKQDRKPPHFIAIERQFALSGTKVRSLALNGHLSSFRKCVMYGNVTTSDADNLMNDIRMAYGLRPYRNRWCCPRLCW